MSAAMFREAVRLLYLMVEDWLWRVTHVERVDHDPDAP